MKAIVRVFICLISLVCTFANASICDSQDSRFIFVNGVFTDYDDYLNTMRKLEKIYDHKRLNPDASVLFEGSYNNTSGLGFDLIESMVQKVQAELNIPRSVSYPAIYQTLYRLPYVGAPVSVIHQLWGLLDPSLTIHNQMNQLQMDTTSLKSMLNLYTTQQRSVILFTHSQGNLFANVAHQELLAESSTYSQNQHLVANIQVASPADEAPISNSEYSTNDKDIIRFIPNSWPGPFTPFDVLDTDVDLRSYLDKFLDHGLLDTYLADYDKGKSNDPFDRLRIDVINKTYIVAANISKQCEEFKVDFEFTIPDSRKPKEAVFSIKSYTDRPQFTWEFGDNTSGVGAESTISHTYESVGEYEVTLTGVLGDQTATIKKKILIAEAPVPTGRCDGAEGSYLQAPGMPGEKVFVAKTATVNPLAIIGGDVEVCENAQVMAAAMIRTSGAGHLKLMGDALINSSATIAIGADVTIEGKILDGANVDVGETTSENVFTLSPEASFGGSVRVRGDKGTVVLKGKQIEAEINSNNARIEILADAIVNSGARLSASGVKASLVILSGEVSAALTSNSTGGGSSLLEIDSKGMKVSGDIFVSSSASGDGEIRIGKTEVSGSMRAATSGTGKAIISMQDMTVDGSFMASALSSGEASLSFTEGGKITSAEVRAISNGAGRASIDFKTCESQSLQADASAKTSDATLTCNTSNPGGTFSVKSEESGSSEISLKNVTSTNSFKALAQALGSGNALIKLESIETATGSVILNTKNGSSTVTTTSSEIGGQVLSSASDSGKSTITLQGSKISGLVNASAHDSSSSSINMTGAQIKGSVGSSSENSSTSSVTISSSTVEGSASARSFNSFTASVSLSGMILTSTVQATAESASSSASAGAELCPGAYLSVIDGETTTNKDTVCGDGSGAANRMAASTSSVESKETKGRSLLKNLIKGIVEKIRK